MVNKKQFERLKRETRNKVITTFRIGNNNYRIKMVF